MEIQKMLKSMELRTIQIDAPVLHCKIIKNNNMVIVDSINEGMLWGENVNIGFSTLRVLQKSWNQEWNTSDFKYFEAWVILKINIAISELTVFT